MYLFGFLGQAAFSGRFIVQWLASEKSKKSVIPVAFWYLSVIGGVILFVYAILRRDPVFTLGQGAGLVVYIRNLILIRRQRLQAAAPPGTDRGARPGE